MVRNSLQVSYSGCKELANQVKKDLKGDLRELWSLDEEQVVS